MSKTDFIYKIVTKAQWDEAISVGMFTGAPVDLEDGYIHFSTAEQMRETAAKHFHGQTDLLLVEVETAPLDHKLKWEVSRGGALFPHLYDVLPTQSAIRVMPIITLPDGSHEFPDGI